MGCSYFGTHIFEADFCIHPENRVNGLPREFKPMETRCIQKELKSAEEIIDQIKEFPSGALGYKRQNMSDQSQKSSSI